MGAAAGRRDRRSAAARDTVPQLTSPSSSIRPFGVPATVRMPALTRRQLTGIAGDHKPRGWQIRGEQRERVDHRRHGPDLVYVSEADDQRTSFRRPCDAASATGGASRTGAPKPALADPTARARARAPLAQTSSAPGTGRQSSGARASCRCRARPPDLIPASHRARHSAAGDPRTSRGSAAQTRRSGSSGRSTPAYQR